MYDLKIDKEFQKLLRKATKEEDEKLTESLIEAGGPDETIKTWGGSSVIVDGHRRYAICKKHGLTYTREALDLESREDVIRWMLLRQLGRRNQTEDEQSEKLTQLFDLEVASNGRWGAKSKVAKDAKVSRATVDRAVEKATLLKKLPKDVAAELKSGNIRCPIEQLRRLVELDDVRKELAFEAIREQQVDDLKAAIPKIMKADADAKETYVDANGKNVPKKLFRVWRTKGGFGKLADELESIRIRLSALADNLESSKLEGLADDAESMASEIRAAEPWTVDSGVWRPRSSSEGK